MKAFGAAELPGSSRVTAAAEKLACLLWPVWASVAAWADRAGSWVNDDRRSLFGMLTAIAAVFSIDAALEIFGDPSVLLIVIACPFVALLLLRVDMALPSKSGVSGERLGALAAFLFMLGLWRIVATLWSRAGGFFGIRETGESASIFLSSYQVRDLTSFFLQEVAASSDPAALGFYYIHHPNFISRLFTMAGIALGMTQERIILACFMVSMVALFLGFLALRRLFGPGLAVAAIGFFGTSYGIFVRQGGDLLRGFHMAMFWILVYLTALQKDAPARGAVGVNMALAVLFVLIASSDWAFLVFCLAFYVMWHIYASRGFAFRHLFSWVFLPVALTFTAYFSAVVAHTGLRFFALDTLVSYFGRMGNVLSGPLLRQVWDPEKFRQLYQSKHIVMWDANAVPAGTHQAIGAYWRAMTAGGFLLAGLLVIAFIGCCTAMVLRISTDRLARGAILALWAAICLGVAPFGWVIVLIGCLILALPRLRLGPIDAAAEPAGRDRLLRDLAAWITICLSAVAITAIAFPNYVFWLWDRGVSPVGLADSLAFALICHLLVCGARPEVWRRALRLEPQLALSSFAGGAGGEGQASRQGELASLRPPEERAALGNTLWRGATPAAAAVIFVLACLHLVGNYELYRLYPPRGPSYAAALRKPEFHGKLFVANTYDALVWYFTRGTSLITTIVPPNSESTKRFRHLSDGDNEVKYSHPDYFLCDNDPYFSFQRVGMINGELCEMPAHCTCFDFMRIMSKEGDTPAFVGPDYVIMKYHYAR
ncbi:MAG: hypothetical protein ACLQME_11515 [Alphaproteobacteria bacterium]